MYLSLLGTDLKKHTPSTASASASSLSISPADLQEILSVFMKGLSPFILPSAPFPSAEHIDLDSKTVVLLILKAQ